jgi:hypothetical protein
MVPTATFPLHPPEADVAADVVLRRLVPFRTHAAQQEAVIRSVRQHGAVLTEEFPAEAPWQF